MKQSSCRTILIIRPSAIGDVVMASPMIKVLREAYPEARILWLAEPQVKDLLRAHPALEKVILWPKGRWKRLLRRGRLLALGRELRRWGAELRREKVDLVLDVQGLLRSRMLARSTGAAERIGFDSKEPGRFLMTRIVSKGPPSERMGSEYLHLMRELGLSPGKFQPDVVLAPEDRQFARDVKEEIGADFAVIAPFTTRPQKHWFEERWVDLIEGLAKKLGLPAVILGGPEDAAGSRRIRSGAREGTYDFTGKTSLGQAAALVAESALVIGVDTGLTHMGTAFQRPTVALFGATCPYLVTASPSTRILYEKFPCSPCRRRPTCDGKFSCMRALSVARVVETAKELLGETDGRG